MAPAPLSRGGGQEVFTQPVGGPQASGQLGGSGAAFAALGDLGNQLHDVGVEVLKPYAAAKGAEDVTRDPVTGELKLETKPAFGELSEAYNHAAISAYAAQSDGDRRIQLQKLANDNIDDPEKFRTDSEAWLKGQANGAPKLVRGDLLIQGRQDIAQYTVNLVNAKRSRDVKIQEAGVKSNLERGWNDVFALARQAGTHTPEFEAALAKQKNQYDALRNPVFGVGDDEITNEIASKLGLAEGEAGLGVALNAYETGGKDAAMAEGEKIFNSADLNLTLDQRNHYEDTLYREVQRREAAKSSALADTQRALRGDIEDAAALAADGGDPYKIVPRETIRTTFGDQAQDIIDKLDLTLDTATASKFVETAAPGQVQAELSRLDPARLFKNNGPTFVAGKDVKGLLTPGNLDLSKRPTVKNADGSISTVRSITVDADGKALLLPTVIGDKVVSNEEAIAHWRKTGENLGVFDNSENADAYAQSLHEEQAAQYGPGGTRSYGYAGDAKRFDFVKKTVERRYTAMEAAIAKRDKALADDPAGYAMTVRPAIAATMRAAEQAQDGASFQKAVTDSINLQRQMGVVAPKILAKPQVTGIVQMFNNPQDPEKRGQHMTGIIAGLEQTYGPMFPQVMGELEKAGLPSEAIALATVKDQPAVSDRMARAINAGRDNLRKIVPGATEVDKGVAQPMSQFDRTLLGQTGAAKVSADFRSAVQLYAYQLVQEGSTESDAAQQAAKDVIAGRYTFADTYRVPSGVNADAVAGETRHLQNTIDPAKISPLGSLIDPKLDEKTRRDMTAKMLRRNGVWATLPDDSGLMLLWPQQNGFAPVLDNAGKPLAFPWATLTAKRPEPPQDFSIPGGL